MFPWAFFFKAVGHLFAFPDKYISRTYHYSDSQVSENIINFLLYTVICLSYVNLTIELSQYDEYLMHQSFVTPASPPTGIAGLMCGAMTFCIPPQYRVSAGLVILYKYTPKNLLL